MASTTARPRRSLRPLTATATPSRASARAMPSPMPAVLPVTSARRPESERSMPAPSGGEGGKIAQRFTLLGLEPINQFGHARDVMDNADPLPRRPDMFPGPRFALRTD